MAKPTLTPDVFRFATRIDRDVLKELSSINDLRSIIVMIADWMLIAGAIALSELYFSYFGYILAVIFIASRQYALAVLMHDGAHGHLLSSRRWNNAASDFFCAWPLFISTQDYWSVHSIHHRLNSTSDDPDWRNQLNEAEYRLPLSRKKLFLFFLRDICGLGVIQQIATLIYVSRKPSGSIDSENSRNKTGLFLRLGFYATLLVVVSLTGSWKLFFMYWIFPLASWLKWFLYVRALSEHHALDLDSAIARTRTVILPWWSQSLIAPHNINYHIEHHLYPNIPQYNLMRLHGLLMQNKVFQEHAVTARGYYQVFRDAFEFVETRGSDTVSSSDDVAMAEDAKISRRG